MQNTPGPPTQPPAGTASGGPRRRRPRRAPDARVNVFLSAGSSSFNGALTFLSPHFHQGTAAEAAAAGPYCPEGGIAQMQSGCCQQYYFYCPKCGTSVSVPVEDKDRDGFTALCSHCSAPITVRGRYASGDPATDTGNPNGYNSTVTPGDNNTSNDNNVRDNNNTGGSWFGGGNWFGGGDGGGGGGGGGE